MIRAGQEGTEQNKQLKKIRNTPSTKDWPLFLGNKSFSRAQTERTKLFKKSIYDVGKPLQYLGECAVCHIHS